MLNKKEKCIFYLIVTIALIITAYLYHTRKTITDKKIMGGSLIGQLMFIAGIALNNIHIREFAHIIFVIVTSIGALYSNEYGTKIYILSSITAVWLCHYYLDQCAFRLLDKTKNPQWAFPPKWLLNYITPFWVIITILSIYSLNA